jgi:membrane-associated protease RseP (regulator of RpoE activity)
MYATKRSGFAMILAIFVVVLVALGGVILLGRATLGPKYIGDKYLHAQAELLADSATEFAMMRAQGFDTTGANCLNNLNIAVNDANGAPAYDINVTLQYSFAGLEPANGQCNTLDQNTSGQGALGEGAMMLIDTIVSSNADANLSTEEIRVTKRTWQKL